jgi:RNA polymerase sigma-70 factor (ECF subfamily)
MTGILIASRPNENGSKMTVLAEEEKDEDLIRATLSGDDEAFAGLVRRHKRKVFSIVARFARNEAELDDISQEVFVKVFQTLKKYRAEAPFEHWVSKITINACYDQLRKQRREGHNVPLDDVAFSLGDLPKEDAGRSEALQILRPALAKLRPEDRMVITLLNLEEKSVREVSALTGWSEANVKVRAFRARKELKRILEGGNGK